MTHTDDLQMIIDEAAVRRLIERYFNAIDAKKSAALASCFSEGARVVLFSGSTSEVILMGNRAIADTIVKYVDNSVTNHSLCNTEISFAGDEGEAETFGITHRVNADGKVFVRGLRYSDTFIRTPDGWRIKERVQHVLWQFNSNAVLPGIPNVDVSTPGSPKLEKQ